MAKCTIFWLALSLIVRHHLAAGYAITGIQAGVNAVTGLRPFRQEFSTFQNSGPQFDLYIQALQQLQNRNQTAMLSYFQVCGIHGYPNIPWDGVDGDPSRVGYCTHGSILFPTWHRPFLALFEQVLWNHAQSIVASYNASSKATYQAAADTFRIPYWDWSLNATMPTLVNVPIVTINTPQGVQNVPNPLYNYKFHPLPGATSFPQGDGISQFLSTVRYPTSKEAHATSRPNLANKNLQANGQSLHDQMYQIFTSTPDYAPFSNTGFFNGSYYNSLENLHNAIHALVGGGGHMSYIAYSSFDPIFWLHHTNVDRLTTIWQALYPNSFTTAEADSYGTYTNPPGEIEDANTPLTPFHSDVEGNLYTSNTVRYTSTFGYAYPEVQDWNINTTQLSANVRAIVNGLYDPSDTTSSRAQNPQGMSANGTSTNAVRYQWAIDITVDVSLVTSSLFLYFYISTPPISPSDWSSAPSLIGSFPVLISPSTPSTPLTIHGLIPLTHTLVPLAKADLAPNIVVPILKQTLHWRAQQLDGSVVAPESFADAFTFKVVARQVRARQREDEFPTYGKWETQSVEV